MVQIFATRTRQTENSLGSRIQIFFGNNLTISNDDIRSTPAKGLKSASSMAKRKSKMC